MDESSARVCIIEPPTSPSLTCCMTSIYLEKVIVIHSGLCSCDFFQFTVTHSPSCAGLCRAVQGCTELCRAVHAQGYAGLCRAVQGCAGLCRSLQGCVHGYYYHYVHQLRLFFTNIHIRAFSRYGFSIADARENLKFGNP